MEQTAFNRKKEPELNKQLIIEAARDIGSETDWHQVTFQAISEKTCLSKGGIIHHFKNKEELLDELMCQNLMELTTWIEQYKAENSDKDGALGYLKFVIEKKDDERYHKTMRILFQAIMINPRFKDKWTNWYRNHIMPTEEFSVKNQMIIMVANGICCSEHMGLRKISQKEKENLFSYIKSLK